MKHVTNTTGLTAFKLSTGEEIIAKIVSCHSTHYTIENPVQLIYQKEGFAGIPYMLWCQRKMNLQICHVVCEAEVEKDIADFYYQQVNKIVAATPGQVQVLKEENGSKPSLRLSL